MLRRTLGKLYLKFFPQPTMREDILERVMRLVSWFGSLGGDYLEFGVHGGKSFIAAFKIAEGYGLKDMRFYAFDSFAGLPEIRGIDQEVPQFSKGEYACSQEDFEKNLRQARVDMSRVKVIPGWYDHTLTADVKKRLPIERAAVVWVDCDLYESTVPVLEFVTDYIADGTIMVFDDWFCFRASPKRGQQRAFREWLAKHPDITTSEYYKHGFTGNSFILHRD